SPVDRDKDAAAPSDDDNKKDAAPSDDGNKKDAAPSDEPSDEADGGTPVSGDKPDSGSTDEPAPVDTAGTAVVVGVWVPGVESGNTYLAASKEVPSEITDLKSTLELPDGLAWQNEEALFFGNFESGQLERYQVDADLKVKRTGAISFASYGIAYINATPLFATPDRAYYLALDLGVGIVWNPREMKITGEIDISSLNREGYSARPGHPYKDNGKVYVPIRYEDEEGTKTAEDSVIAALDIETEAIDIERDDRAPGAWSGFVSKAGDFYTLADAAGGSYGLSGIQKLKNPAVLRMKKGSGELDPDYLFDLGEALGTQGIYGLWPLSDTSFLVQAWPSDVDPVRTTDEYWGVKFKWMLLDAAAQTSRVVEGVEDDTPQVLIPMQVDGRGFIQQRVPGAGEKMGLYEVDPKTGKTSLAITAPNAFWFLGRLKTL
ncbi:MAG: DUF4374 domain-containing protein, partial [Polyangiales bacterium]